MATVTPTSLQGPGVRTVTENVLAVATHDFVYRPGTGQIAIFRNHTGVGGQFRFSGADSVTWGVPGAGNLPAAPTWSNGVAAGQTKIVCFDEIRAYLQGVTTMIISTSACTVILLNP